MYSHVTGRLRVVAAVIAVAAVLTSPATVLGANEPNGAASCIGIELAAISPPGSSDEEPGGPRQFVTEIKEFAGFLGVRPGQLFRFVASLHEGSHEACDEALSE